MAAAALEDSALAKYAEAEEKLRGGDEDGARALLEQRQVRGPK